MEDKICHRTEQFNGRQHVEQILAEGPHLPWHNVLSARKAACNYLALGMIYLQHNPLLKEPLKAEHIKNRLLGHWGASPGLAFIYTHLNRAIKLFDQNIIFLAGPGHGAPGVLGPVYLKGASTDIYPEMSEDETGLHGFF